MAPDNRTLLIDKKGRWHRDLGVYHAHAIACHYAGIAIHEQCVGESLLARIFFRIFRFIGADCDDLGLSC